MEEDVEDKEYSEDLAQQEELNNGDGGPVDDLATIEPDGDDRVVQEGS